MTIDILANICCCPVCKNDFKKIPTFLVQDKIKTGFIFCDICNEYIGAINDYKYNFVDFISPASSTQNDFNVIKQEYDYEVIEIPFNDSAIILTCYADCGHDEWLIQ